MKIASNIIFFSILVFSQINGFAQEASCPDPQASCQINYVSAPGLTFGLAQSNDGQWLFVGVTPKICNAGACAYTGGVALYKIIASNPVYAGEFLIKNSVNATDLKLSMDGRLLVVANGNFVSFIDTYLLISYVTKKSAVNPLLGTINDGPIGAGKSAGSVYLDITNDQHFLFVSDEGLQQITVIDLQKARANHFNQSSIVGAVPAGQSPVGMAFSPDQKYLYTTSEVALPSWGWTAPEQGQGALIVVDVKQAEKNPANAVFERVPAGIQPVRLVVSALDNSIFVTARGSNSLDVFNMTKLIYDPDDSLRSEIPVGTSPVGVSMVDFDRYILVANSNRFANPPQGSLSLLDRQKIDTGSPALVETIPAQLFPREIISDIGHDTVFVSNYSSSSIEVIHGLSLIRRR